MFNISNIFCVFLFLGRIYFSSAADVVVRAYSSFSIGLEIIDLLYIYVFCCSICQSFEPTEECLKKYGASVIETRTDNILMEMKLRCAKLCTSPSLLTVSWRPFIFVFSCAAYSIIHSYCFYFFKEYDFSGLNRTEFTRMCSFVEDTPANLVREIICTCNEKYLILCHGGQVNRFKTVFNTTH